MSDFISRQDAIDALWKALYEYEDKTEKQFIESDELDVEDWVQHRIFVQNMNDIDRQIILDLPSAKIVEIKHGEWVPVTDVVEVKHGEWVRTEVGSEKSWKCSECGYQPVHYSTQVKPYEHYCGNCGAKMSGGRKDDKRRSDTAT